MNNILIRILLLTAVLLQSACASFLNSDDNSVTPAPLVSFKQEMPIQHVWTKTVGKGDGGHYLRLAPARYNEVLYIADPSGVLQAIDANTGKVDWRVAAKSTFTTTPASDGQIVAVGTGQAQISVFSASTGDALWHKTVSSEVLSAPAVSHGRIFVKTIDGKLYAFDKMSGERLWVYDNGAPALVLRASSSPVVSGNRVIAGFSDGRLAVLEANSGRILWRRNVSAPSGSSPVEQMVDIDADPLVDNNVVYVTSYQGQMVAYSLTDGARLWDHALSSYTGLALNNKLLYVTDSDGQVWAFQAQNGIALWRQQQLLARQLSPPSFVKTKNVAILGDGKGYLHIMSPTDGHFLARVQVGSKPIRSAPLVWGNRVYVLASNGVLSRYDFS